MGSSGFLFTTTKFKKNSRTVLSGEQVRKFENVPQKEGGFLMEINLKGEGIKLISENIGKEREKNGNEWDRQVPHIWRGIWTMRNRLTCLGCRRMY